MYIVFDDDTTASLVPTVSFEQPFGRGEGEFHGRFQMKKFFSTFLLEGESGSLEPVCTNGLLGDSIMLVAYLDKMQMKRSCIRFGRRLGNPRSVKMVQYTL